MKIAVAMSGGVDSSGTSKTQTTVVAGVSVRAAPFLTAHASLVREGWDRASSTLSAYPEDDGRRDEFDEAVGEIALGVEGTLLDDRLTLRA